MVTYRLYTNDCDLINDARVAYTYMYINTG